MERTKNVCLLTPPSLSLSLPRKETPAEPARANRRRRIAVVANLLALSDAASRRGRQQLRALVTRLIICSLLYLGTISDPRAVLAEERMSASAPAQ